MKKSKNIKKKSGVRKTSSTKSYDSKEKIRKIIDYVEPNVMRTKNGFAKDFWWQAVSNQTYVKNWFNHVPNCLRALCKLCFGEPQFYSEEEKNFSVNVNDKECRANTLLLIKSKKEYFKPNVLEDVGKYIMATTNSSQNIKYIFFGMMSDSKRYSDDFKNLERETSQMVKIYEKEKQAFVSAGLMYVGKQEVEYKSHEDERDIGTLIFDKYDHYLGEEKRHYPSYDAVIHYKGWLFEIPKNLTISEIHNLCNEIKTERYKQEHIL